MGRPAKVMNDPHLLEAALEGLQLQRQRIDQQIEEVRTLLGQRRSALPAANGGGEAEPRKRELSDAARRRIAAAQKKRWAEYRKTAAQSKAKQEA